MTSHAGSEFVFGLGEDHGSNIRGKVLFLAGLVVEVVVLVAVVGAMAGELVAFVVHLFV
jgi:hypothetical protein